MRTKMTRKYCKSDNFRACNFLRFSDFGHFCLFLNLLFSAILYRPTHKINTFVHFIFALAQKCTKSAKNNVAQKFPLLQFITGVYPENPCPWHSLIYVTPKMHSYKV